MNNYEQKLERYYEWMRSEGLSISQIWKGARKLGLPLIPFEFWNPWAIAFCQMALLTLFFAGLIFLFGRLISISPEAPMQIVWQTLAVNLGVNTGAAWRTKSKYDQRKIHVNWEKF